MSTARSILIAVLLVIIVTSQLNAQTQPGTTLGRWVLRQPLTVQSTIGCNYRPPYATYCWQHITRNGKIVETIHYRQDDGRIVSWRTPNR